MVTGLTFSIQALLRISRKASAGKTKRFSAVHVIKPTRMTIAIGYSISRPAAPQL
jgi:hypothetical protein